MAALRGPKILVGPALGTAGPQGLAQPEGQPVQLLSALRVCSFLPFKDNNLKETF